MNTPFYLRRFAQEMAAARTARDSRAKVAHQKMANAYEKILDETLPLDATIPRWGTLLSQRGWELEEALDDWARDNNKRAPCAR
jgi:hypothetical protein